MLVTMVEVYTEAGADTSPNHEEKGSPHQRRVIARGGELLRNGEYPPVYLLIDVNAGPPIES